MATATAPKGRNRRIARPSPMIIGFAVLGAAAIAVATLCPIGMRPHLLPANGERFVAYAVLGALVSRASGRRWLLATAIVVLVALSLEAAQRLVPGRDAAVADAMVKALGGVLGSGAAQLAFPIRRLAARNNPSDGRQATSFSGRASPPAVAMKLATSSTPTSRVRSVKT
mgnify:CR=1 FL=1